MAAGGSMAASNKAAKGQQGAADAATAVQQGIYDDTRSRNDPFYYAGTDALSRLQQNMGRLSSGYDESKLMDSAGYQFGLQQGQQALERSLAARGRGVSGAAMKAAAEYGTNYGTTKLNDAYARDQQSKQQEYNPLMGLVNIGQSSANNTAAAGAQFASQAGGNIIGAGNANAANRIAQGNIWGNLVNQGVSAYQNRNTGSTTAPAWSTAGGGSGMMTNNDGFYSASAGDGTMYLADGGPIPERREPKIGTKAPPRKGSGGGAMSREAIQAALAAPAANDASSAPRNRGIGQLPGNPVTNPRAIIDGRERDAGIGYADGGAIQSTTSGRADDIPVNASGGEFMVNADAVSALGDGNTEAGQRLLQEMVQRVLEHSNAQRQARAQRTGT